MNNHNLLSIKDFVVGNHSPCPGRKFDLTCNLELCFPGNRSPQTDTQLVIREFLESSKRKLEMLMTLEEDREFDRREVYIAMDENYLTYLVFS